MDQSGRVELALGATRGSLLVADERRILPVGSTLAGGVFYWQPGLGFFGEYRLLFERSDGRQIPVLIRIVAQQ
jgi:hypothetical protein